MIKQQLGNPEILNLKKTAFLCSRKVPASPRCRAIVPKIRMSLTYLLQISSCI